MMTQQEYFTQSGMDKVFNYLRQVDPEKHNCLPLRVQAALCRAFCVAIYDGALLDRLTPEEQDEARQMAYVADRVIALRTGEGSNMILRAGIIMGILSRDYNMDPGGLMQQSVDTWRVKA